MTSKSFLKSIIRTVAKPLFPQLFYRPIDISDETVNWICFANAGMLERGNLYLFDYAIKNLPSDAPILEIGSFMGLSTNLLSYLKQKNGRTNRLITCDKWDFEGARGSEKMAGLPVTHAEYKQYSKETYMRNVRFFSANDLPWTIEMISNEFFDAWNSASTVNDVFGRPLQLGGPFSFCYIDGNHSFEAARQDFLNCDLYLEKGGCILFDDSADGTVFEGLAKLMIELKTHNSYEIVATNPNYLFRKRL